MADKPGNVDHNKTGEEGGRNAKEEVEEKTKAKIGEEEEIKRR